MLSISSLFLEIVPTVTTDPRSPVGIKNGYVEDTVARATKSLYKGEISKPTFDQIRRQEKMKLTSNSEQAKTAGNYLL